ncbi:MAG: glycosyltransferase family 9 protein, partial [Deltaproteobacteria bacterium]
SSPDMEQTYKKILIVNLGGIGDLMLSSPALRAIRSWMPDARLCLLTAAPSAEYARLLPYIDEVHTLEIGRGFLRLAAGLGVLLFLRKERFDLCVNMRTIVSARSRRGIRLVFDLIRAGRTAGRDTDGRGDFFDIRIKEDGGDTDYEMEYDLSMARTLTGRPVEDRTVDFPVDDAARARVERLLSDGGAFPGTPVIGLHLGGKPSHAWPEENFAAAAAMIDQKRESIFVLTGDSRDGERARAAFAGTAPRSIDLTGKLTLVELGAVIARCGLYITSDSAPMHIAAALGTPLVAIFGPGYIRRFDPRRILPGAVVLSAKTPCAPCDRVTCPSLRCLKAITPEEAARAAIELLSGGDHI